MHRSARFWLSFCFAAPVVLAAGCGASSDGTAFDGDPDSGAPRRDAGRGGSSDGGVSDDAGVSEDGSASNDGGPASDASASTDAASVGDAATDSGAAIDAGSGVDAGSDGGSTTSDPFDPDVCPGPTMSATRAAMLLGGNVRSALASADLVYRDRTCPEDGGACSAWTATAPLVMTLLTYSGGVTTHYKSFAFPLTFVLWNHGSSSGASYGFSVRHSSDYAHDATDDLHGVAFPFGTTSVMYPKLYVWDDHPDHPSDYPDPEWQWYHPATLTATDSCARFYIDDVQAGSERQLVAVFHY